jgi:hypothetical protein
MTEPVVATGDGAKRSGKDASRAQALAALSLTPAAIQRSSGVQAPSSSAIPKGPTRGIRLVLTTICETV